MADPLFEMGAAVIFGATGGIGRVITREFARAGCDIAIMYRTKEETAQALERDITDTGRKVSIHHCDVTDNGTLNSAIRAAARAHERIHTMVWAAGPLVAQVLIAQSDRGQWRRAIDVETHGFFDACQALLPHMRAQGGGSFVHLGSAGEIRFPPRDFLSVVPKAANESLVKGIAREEGVHNIRANSVLVGVIEAGMFLELTRQGAFDEDWVQDVQKNLALKRWGQPEEIAQAAIFLASNKALYITGQQLNVSGGYGL